MGVGNVLKSLAGITIIKSVKFKFWVPKINPNMKHYSLESESNKNLVPSTS